MPYAIKYKKSSVLSIQWGKSPFLRSGNWQSPYIQGSKRYAASTIKHFMHFDNKSLEAQGLPLMKRKDFKIVPISIRWQ